jgi:hypothetical protein
MSKEQSKKSRPIKKVTEESSTVELEAKIAELEAKLSDLSSKVKHTESPKPEPKPQQRPTASGPTHGTLPAGFKPVESPKPEVTYESSSHNVSESDVAPAYAKISETGYTGNKYFATRKRLSYHPANKQFTGSSTTTTTAPPAPKPEPQPEPQTHSSRGTLPSGTKPQEKSSMWKAKGADAAETYGNEQEHESTKQQQRPTASGPTHGTLPAGFKPAEEKPVASKSRGTLPAGF